MQTNKIINALSDVLDTYNVNSVTLMQDHKDEVVVDVTISVQFIRIHDPVVQVYSDNDLFKETEYVSSFTIYEDDIEDWYMDLDGGIFSIIWKGGLEVTFHLDV